MTLAKADIANMRQSAIFYLAVNNMHQGYIDEALKQLKQASRECFDLIHNNENKFKVELKQWVRSNISKF